MLISPDCIQSLLWLPESGWFSIEKTSLSGRTNRIVGGEAPSKYLVRLQKHAGVSDEEFQDILKSHVLSPEFLYADDFVSFFNDRKARILQRIEKAKPIILTFFSG